MQKIGRKPLWMEKYTVRQISVIKHEAVGGPGFNPAANEETLPQQESEETHETGSQGGHRGAKDLEA